ncbi:MAG: hypothetical protein ACYTCV_09190 [Planctomycetota bacterium]
MKHWKVLFICLMLVFLGIALREVYFASLGPDAKIQLDMNHYLEGWPGFIVQYKPKGSSDLVLLADENSQVFYPSGISKYAVSDKYIVAEAEEGWLAINRESLQVWGCYKTVDELEIKIGESFGDLDIVEEFTQSNMYIPPVTWYAMLVFVIITGSILSLPILFRKLKKPKNRKNRDSSALYKT